MSRRPKRQQFPQRVGADFEQQQADLIAQEWEFWRTWTEVLFLYQVNDGVNADEAYGIRGCSELDGTLTDWKPRPMCFPRSRPPCRPLPERFAYCVRPWPCRSRCRDGPGSSTRHFPKGQTQTVLSVHDDGSYGAVPVEKAGAWETWKPSQDRHRPRGVFRETIGTLRHPVGELMDDIDQALHDIGRHLGVRMTTQGYALPSEHRPLLDRARERPDSRGGSWRGNGTRRGRSREAEATEERDATGDTRRESAMNIGIGAAALPQKPCGRRKP